MEPCVCDSCARICLPSCAISREWLSALADPPRAEEERSPPISVCKIWVARGRFVVFGDADRVRHPAGCACEPRPDGSRVCDCVPFLRMAGPECRCAGCQVAFMLTECRDRGFTRARYIPNAWFDDPADAHISRCADSLEVEFAVKAGAKTMINDLATHASTRRPKRLAIDEVD